MALFEIQDVSGLPFAWRVVATIIGFLVVFMAVWVRASKPEAPPEKPTFSATTTGANSPVYQVAGNVIVNEKKGRRLEGRQRQDFINELKKTPNQSVIFWYAPRNSEIDAYAAEIKSALTEAGWSYGEAKKIPLIPLEGQGVYVLVHDKNKPPQGANRLMMALAAAGQAPTGQPHNLVEKDSEIGLFIGYE